MADPADRLPGPCLIIPSGAGFGDASEDEQLARCQEQPDHSPELDYFYSKPWIFQDPLAMKRIAVMDWDEKLELTLLLSKKYFKTSGIKALEDFFTPKNLAILVGFFAAAALAEVIPVLWPVTLILIAVSLHYLGEAAKDVFECLKRLVNNTQRAKTSLDLDDAALDFARTLGPIAVNVGLGVLAGWLMSFIKIGPKGRKGSAGREPINPEKFAEPYKNLFTQEEINAWGDQIKEGQISLPEDAKPPAQDPAPIQTKNEAAEVLRRARPKKSAGKPGAGTVKAQPIPPDAIVQRMPDGRLSIRSRVRSPQARAGAENAIPPATEVGLEGWDRAHSQGPGLGAENPEGIRYAPLEVNRGYMSRVENAIRELYKLKPEGVELELTTVTETHPNTLRLKSIEYQVDEVRGGQRTPIWSAEITIQNQRISPRIGISVDHVSASLFGGY
jgi:hypothetical protein